MSTSTTLDPKEFAGNWMRFQSFGWHDQPEDGENWGIYHLDSRDSDLLGKSNADVIRKEMLRFKNTVVEQHFRHWACGWVDAIAVKVFKKNGETTKAFEKLVDLIERMADYPALDEEDWSKREYEATVENIEEAGRRFLNDQAPEDWAKQAFSWLWDNIQREIDAVDGGGGYPSEEGMKQCLKALGWLDPDYDDTDHQEG